MSILIPKNEICDPISFPHKLMSFQAIHLIFSSGKIWKSNLSKNENFLTPSRISGIPNDQRSKGQKLEEQKTFAG